MSLDIGFYKQDRTEVLSLRNHHDLFKMLNARPVVTIEPYSDFYVTRPMLTALLEEIEDEMTASGLLRAALPDPENGRDALEALCAELPWEFSQFEPEDWTAALPVYRIALTYLLAEVLLDGCLICGWSA